MKYLAIVLLGALITANFAEACNSNKDCARNEVCYKKGANRPGYCKRI